NRSGVIGIRADFGHGLCVRGAARPCSVLDILYGRDADWFCRFFLLNAWRSAPTSRLDGRDATVRKSAADSLASETVWTPWGRRRILDRGDPGAWQLSEFAARAGAEEAPAAVETEPARSLGTRAGD